MRKSSYFPSINSLHFIIVSISNTMPLSVQLCIFVFMSYRNDLRVQLNVPSDFKAKS